MMTKHTVLTHTQHTTHSPDSFQGEGCLDLWDTHSFLLLLPVCFFFRRGGLLDRRADPRGGAVVPRALRAGRVRGGLRRLSLRRRRRRGRGGGGRKQKGPRAVPRPPGRNAVQSPGPVAGAFGLWRRSLGQRGRGRVDGGDDGLRFFAGGVLEVTRREVTRREEGELT